MEETKSFLVFSEGIKWKHWPEMRNELNKQYPHKRC